jgi:hypothetical protein
MKGVGRYRGLSPDFCFPPGAYCLVADWAILDIEVTKRQLKAITDRGLVPALVYALTVIQDSKGRFLPGLGENHVGGFFL